VVRVPATSDVANGRGGEALKIQELASIAARRNFAERVSDASHFFPDDITFLPLAIK
jgi:hypothetical protein